MVLVQHKLMLHLNHTIKLKIIYTCLFAFITLDMRLDKSVDFPDPTIPATAYS